MLEYRVEIFDDVEKQLDDIVDYITDELEAPLSALNVLADLEAAMESLSMFPKRVPIIQDEKFIMYELRRLVVRQYLIYFTVDDWNRQVNIVAIIYGKRDQAAAFKQFDFVFEE